MGEDGGNPADQPAHRVLLSAFLSDRHEVTNAQFRRFVEATKYRTDAERIGRGSIAIGTDWVEAEGASWEHPGGRDSGLEGRENHPVVLVSWNDATVYARWAGKRLPTEAEFERLLRGGPEGRKYPWGDGETPPPGSGNLADGAFLRERPGKSAFAGYDDGFPELAPVASSSPNGLGLFDISGNVWEWCSDQFDPSYYASSPARDPTGPARGGVRVLRGGAWCEPPPNMRCVVRMPSIPSLRNGRYGFRCVRGLAE